MMKAKKRLPGCYFQIHPLIHYLGLVHRRDDGMFLIGSLARFLPGQEESQVVINDDNLLQTLT
ncbi:unnamed protein product [Prunus armeniaca]